MFKKFFLYVMLPSLVLCFVYSSGVSSGKRASKEESIAPAWTEFPVVKGPEVMPDRTVSSEKIEARPVVAKPKLAPSEPVLPEHSVPSRPVPSHFSTVDEFGSQVISRGGVPVVSSSQAEKPLPIKPIKRKELMPVPEKSPAADCDCGKKHK